MNIWIAIPITLFLLTPVNADDLNTTNNFKPIEEYSVDDISELPAMIPNGTLSPVTLEQMTADLMETADDWSPAPWCIQLRQKLAQVPAPFNRIMNDGNYIVERGRLQQLGYSGVSAELLSLYLMAKAGRTCAELGGIPGDTELPN